MGATEIIVIVAASLLVVFTVGYNILRRKKNKGCGGSCSGCPVKNRCNSKGKK